MSIRKILLIALLGLSLFAIANGAPKKGANKGKKQNVDIRSNNKQVNYCFIIISLTFISRLPHLKNNSNRSKPSNVTLNYRISPLAI